MSFVESEIAAAAAAEEQNGRHQKHDGNDQFDFGVAQRENAFNFSPVMEEMESLRAHNQSLEEAVQYHKNNMKFQTDRINQLEYEKAALNNKVTELQAEAAQLKDRNTNLETAIYNLHRSLRDLDSLVKAGDVLACSAGGVKTPINNTGDVVSATLMQSPVSAPDLAVGAGTSEIAPNQSRNNERTVQQQQVQRETPTERPNRHQMEYGQSPAGVNLSNYELAKPKQTFIPPMMPRQPTQQPPNQSMQRQQSVSSNLAQDNTQVSASFAPNSSSAEEMLQQIQQQQRQQHQLQHNIQQNQQQQQHLRLSMPPPPSTPSRNNTQLSTRAPVSQMEISGMRNMKANPASATSIAHATPARPVTTSKWFRSSSPASQARLQNIHNLVYSPPRPSSSVPKPVGQIVSHQSLHGNLAASTSRARNFNEFNQFSQQQSPSQGLKRSTPMTPSHSRQLSNAEGYSISGGGVSLQGMGMRRSLTSAGGGTMGGTTSSSGGLVGRGSPSFGPELNRFNEVTDLLVPNKRRKPWVPSGGN